MNDQLGTWLRAAAWTVRVSGLLAAVGIAFLTAMFAAFALGATSAGQVLGRVNDTLVLVSYLLTAPSVVALALITRDQRPRLDWIVAAVGLAAIAAIVVLQAMLITEILTFEQQIGPVSVALLLLGAWFVVAGYRASRSGAVPNGGWMGLLAASYVGYPIWAIWIGRHFLRLAAATPSQPRSVIAD